jgi:hypothetical protein
MGKTQFDDFKFVKEYPTILAGKHPLRLYRSRFSPDDLNKPIEKYRWHFGFPKNIVEPVGVLLETTPYWGEVHWKEEDGFWIYWLHDVSDASEEEIPSKLNKTLDFYLRSYNQVIGFYKRAAQKEKEKEHNEKPHKF